MVNNNEDKGILINEIKKIVDEMGCYKENYVFLDNSFITRQLLIYDYRKIITFFVKKSKNNSLKKYCFQSRFFSFHNDLILGLIEKRIKKQEYEVDKIEDIALIDDDRQLFFIDDYGAHYFKISKNDIYGFDQTDQISRFKKFVDKIYESIKSNGI